MTSIKKLNGRRPANNHSRNGNTGSTRGGSSITGTTRGGSTRGGQNVVNDLNLFQILQGKTDRFSDMLVQNAGDNPWAQFLASQGIFQGDNEYMSSGQRADWNKQILDTMLKYYQDLEERQYTQGVLNEQRIYDSPTNQLARLMGAGVSRDAAIAMLSGQGNSPTVAQGVEAVPGTSPTESLNNEMQRKLGIANAVFSGIDCLSSLVGLGFSVPQAIYQTSLLRGQAFLQKKDLDALQSTDDAFSILNAAGAGADAFGSASAAIGAITDLAKHGDVFAAQFIQRGGISKIRGNGSLASNRFRTLGASEKDFEYNAGRYLAEMDMYAANKAFTEMNTQKVAQEIENAKAEYSEICAQTVFIEQNTLTIQKQAEVFENQAKLLEKQGRTEDSKAYLTKAQGLRQKLENDEVSALHNASMPALEYSNGENTVVQRSGLEWMTFDALNKIVSEGLLSAKQTNPDYLNAVYHRMFSDADAITQANALQALKDKAGIEFFTKYPQQAELYTALEKCHAYDYLNCIRNGVYEFRAGQTIFGMSFDTNKVGNTTAGFFDQFNK